MTRPLESAAVRAAWALVSACAGGALAAQVPYGPPTSSQWQQPQGQGQGQQGQEPGPWRPQVTSPWGDPALDPEVYGIGDPFRLESVWMVPGLDIPQGFPVFPPNLSGYGGYPPAPPGLLLGPNIRPMPLLPLPPSPPDWPAWIKAKLPPDLPYDQGLAVLVRHSDRVWFRLPDDDAFEPLYHWDTTRGLPAGSAVRVPQTGAFLLLLHGGGLVRSFGACELRIEQLGEAAPTLALDRFTRFRLTTIERSISCRLPDGSRLEIEAPPPGAVTPGTADVVLETVDEPAWYGGRATIFNAGDRPVSWQAPIGTIAIDPGRRVTVFLVPAAERLEPLPSELSAKGVETEAVGPVRRFRGGEAGSVSWSGARFELPAGAVLELDPLLGDVFKSKPAAVTAPAEGKQP
jgi:hypothetical protein